MDRRAAIRGRQLLTPENQGYSFDPDRISTSVSNQPAEVASVMQPKLSNAVFDVACENWSPMDGYGQVATMLVEGLRSRHGIEVNVVGNSRSLETVVPGSSAWEQLTRRRLPSAGSILLGYPTRFQNLETSLDRGIRVAITMFESTRLPPGWVEALNRLDGVIVPSRWLEETFRREGVTVPLHRVPLGIKECYRPLPRPVGRSPFTFLTLTTPYPRKGWDVAVRAFNMAFGRDPRYRLLIKIRGGRKLPVRMLHPGVEVIAEDLDDEGMASLFGSVDAFVFPTRGEGFGLPPREAAATGLPVVATAWGGTADDLDQWGWPLQSKLAAAWPGYGRLDGLGEWAEPDVRHLSEVMCQIAAGGPAIRERSLFHAEQVRALYTWPAFVDRVWRITSDAAAASDRAATPSSRP